MEARGAAGWQEGPVRDREDQRAEEWYAGKSSWAEDRGQGPRPAAVTYPSARPRRKWRWGRGLLSFTGQRPGLCLAGKCHSPRARNRSRCQGHRGYLRRAGCRAAKVRMARGRCPQLRTIRKLLWFRRRAGLTGSRTRYSDPLYVLMLAVGIILLIACANVAGLMLSRATARQKEVAVRLALGAGRTRIVRQLLTESVMLSVAGGALGILFAYWGAHAIISFVSNNQTRPLGFATGVDMRVLGFSAAVSLVTGIVFGIAPALRSSRVNLMPALKEGEGSSASSGHASGRWFSIGNGLVVAQVALAIVVLVGAGLLVRTLENLRSVDLGFDAHNIVIFSIDPTLAGYKDTQVDSFYRDLRGRLAETPGVRAASYSQMPLLSGGLMITGFHWPGTPQDQESDADVLNVGADFFATMHIPFVAGRNFTASDFDLAGANSGATPTKAPTPVIVNQAFVEKYLGKGKSARKRIRPGWRGRERAGQAGL